MKIPVLPPKKPIRLESRMTDLQSTFLGKILFKVVLSVPAKDERKARRLPEGIERDNGIKGAQAIRRMLETSSLMTLSMSAGGGFPYNLALGFREMANGHLFKGIKCFASKIKAPVLPKDVKAKK